MTVMKRKQSYEQAMAAERNFAKGRQMRKAHARLREQLAQEAANAPQHSHFWSDWSMDATEPLEHRSCRCGATETRKFRGL
jgi:hypothetical protein